MPTKEKKPPKNETNHKVINIIVNGRPIEVTEKRLSFIEVVNLAFPNAEIGPDIVYTVTYKNGPKPNPKGVMVDGDIVKIKSGEVFNVTRTDKS